MFEIYQHKGTPQNIAVSPQGNMTSSPNLSEGLALKKIGGIAIIAGHTVSTGKQIVNATIQNTGDIEIQRAMEYVGRGSAFLGTAYITGLPVAIALEGVRVAGSQIVSAIQNIRTQADSDYRQKIRGVAINNFTGKGVAYD